MLVWEFLSHAFSAISANILHPRILWLIYNGYLAVSSYSKVFEEWIDTFKNCFSIVVCTAYPIIHSHMQIWVVP